ncbi:MAG: tetratricopeptide repeat protein, partial [Thermoanaerobaculia bacterium]
QRIVERFFGRATSLVAGLPSIPLPTRDFAGRTDELQELRQKVREHGGAVIYGVRGLGGIGKTELCRRLVAEIGGDYPDGHVLVDLRGASEKPLSPSEALAEVIRAYEPQARLPDAERDLRRLYDQVLKDRRAIVFLDDAASADQVKPLLPHPGCLTLVTSRQRFSLPKLHRLDLDSLTPEAARELLLSLAPRLGSEADRIAELLGRLPLALRLAGGAFAERPDLEPEEYVHKLESRDERVGLIEAAIDFNYSALDAEVQRRWRALAVFPGSFDAEGAAAVWDLAVDAAKDLLGGALYTVSLVEWREGRYRLHDLARDFAAQHLQNDERRLAARRHAGHYVEVLREADRLYLEGGEGLLEGLALFDREWRNIEAGQAWAVANAGEDRQATEYSSSYPDAGLYCLNLRLHSHEWIRWLEAHRSAAVTLGDRRGEGNALGNLGIAYYSLGEVEKAIGYYEQALVIVREIGDRRGEGKDLGNLGLAYAALGEVEKAIGYYEQALVIAREIGDRHGEGADLGNLGIAYAALGEVEKAIGYYEQALVIVREIGDRRDEGADLGNLGSAYYRLGEVEKAIGYYEQRLVIACEIGDRRGEGNALGNLGIAYADLGEVDKAIPLLEQALEIGQAIKDPRIVDEVAERLEELRGS